MYISMCLYIIITIMLWVLSIYSFIKHYTIVILCEPYNLISYLWLCIDTIAVMADLQLEI